MAQYDIEALVDAGGGIAQVPRFSAPPLARSME